ncbi:murein L,D-transpeptidase catalytic domain family protein [Marinobacter sp. BGYM27]|uniref:murein L,D-transpeptidase catalytic domain family protein n=1 Tax=unclassified Marinobacter TaxID=83889 RepID=UPI0021A2CC9F|nr:murein L,D-transpeptidase catalytic domain family protein [Marinobacter sp. BGYM27]MDG5499474.1 murein L,D-transpeptidase catalytic domain family protein [Marinobacter sp. BGYM27]
MTNKRPCSLLAIAMSVLFAFQFSASAQAGVFNDALLANLSKSAPNLNKGVLKNALQASQCAISSGLEQPQRLAVIDFSLPSTERRLWIFDLKSGALVLRDLVAHGRNSGDNMATAFSNVEGSHQSSIGLFQASETYRGKHGYSLRLDGLESGVNDLARQRAIVIHGADYVDPSWIANYGRIGRSLGCPAVSQKIIRRVVDNLKGGQFVFTYYPDQKWLQSSDMLHCGRAQMAGADHADIEDNGRI